MATANFVSLNSNKTMEFLDKNTERQQHSVAPDAEDKPRYEEFSLNDECKVTEEENLEATVKNRAEAAVLRPNSTLCTQQQSMVHFLRSFLYHYNMTETLECFETEWNELVQKGLLDAGRIHIVPDVYIENLRLESELKNARWDREEYKHTSAVSADVLQRVQRTRDAHRLQHKRVLQEKNRLIDEMKRLKSQCDSYEISVKRMKDKYQAVLKQVLVSVERNKLLKSDLSFSGGEEGAENQRKHQDVKDEAQCSL